MVEWFRALDLKSGGPWFKSSTLLLSGFVLRSHEFNSSTGCQSFRLQVDSPTSRSFRLHDQVVSPTRSESIRVHSSRFAYSYKSKCFVKNHCLQLPGFWELVPVHSEQRRYNGLPNLYKKKSSI